MRRIVCTLGLLMVACLPGAAQTQQPIRVRCGGSSYTDSQGQIWQADNGFNGGATGSTTHAITGTPDPKLFQDERYANTSTPILYKFPVANGAYHVNLLFAEIYSPLDVVGARVFNVKMQGNVVFSKLDIFASAGADAALVKGADVLVQNGVLSIELDSVVQNAKVDAIEILPLPAQAPPLNLNFTYPDGTPVVGTLGYTISSSLLSYQGSVALSNGQATCVLLNSATTMGLSMQFTVNLSLTDATGHLLWQLNLGLNPSQINLAAVLNGSLSVTVQHP